MKSTVLSLLFANAALARQVIYFKSDANATSTPAPQPTVHSRFFRARDLERENWRLSTWNAQTSQLDYNVDTGIIHHGTGPDADITSIFSVRIPAGAGTQTCEVYLETEPSPDSEVQPEGAEFEIYRLTYWPDSTTVEAGYPAIGYRQPVLGVAAAHIGMDSTPAITFDCPENQWIGLEFVPVTTSDVHIEWDDRVTGPFVNIVGL